MRESRVRSLDQEDPREEGMATYSSILALKNPHGQRNLAGYRPWGHTESGTTERLTLTHSGCVCVCVSHWRLGPTGHQALGREGGWGQAPARGRRCERQAMRAMESWLPLPWEARRPAEVRALVMLPNAHAWPRSWRACGRSAGQSSSRRPERTSTRGDERLRGGGRGPRRHCFLPPRPLLARGSRSHAGSGTPEAAPPGAADTRRHHPAPPPPAASPGFRNSFTGCEHKGDLERKC